MSKKLLFSITKKDLKISYFSGKGAGGQNRNRHMNCVRISHPESGAESTGQSHKEKRANVKEALQSLVKKPKFKTWHSRKVQELMSGKTIDETVAEMMAEENLKIEKLDEDERWIPYE